MGLNEMQLGTCWGNRWEQQKSKKPNPSPPHSPKEKKSGLLGACCNSLLVEQKKKFQLGSSLSLNYVYGRGMNCVDVGRNVMPFF
jgi:hypothetical protein